MALQYHQHVAIESISEPVMQSNYTEVDQKADKIGGSTAHCSRGDTTQRVFLNIEIIFIHLNLCTALALSLALFIAGIENSTSNEVSVSYYI